MNGQYRGLGVRPCSIKTYLYDSFREWHLSDYNSVLSEALQVSVIHLR